MKGKSVQNYTSPFELDDTKGLVWVLMEGIKQSAELVLKVFLESASIELGRKYKDWSEEEGGRASMLGKELRVGQWVPGRYKEFVTSTEVLFVFFSWDQTYL